jgi:carbamate kinase
MVLAVIALGGNAILRAGEEATLTNQMRHLQLTCRHIMNVLDGFDDLVITHGNGPQVGDIVMQNELSREDIPPMPLDVCVAESQGQMGYMIQLSLLNALELSGKDADVFCTLGTVLIDNRHLHDLSTKPIGPFYSASEVEVLRAERDWEFVEDLRRGGYRRVVPSPPPIQVLGIEVMRRLIGQVGSRKLILVTGGGGGVPVHRLDRHYEGVEAVVDKDLTSALIARELNADTLIMLTDIEAVYKDFRTRSPSMIREATASEMMGLLAQGQFPTGSMGPKVTAACQFVEGGGKAVITNAEHLESALAGRSGTTVVKER